MVSVKLVNEEALSVLSHPKEMKIIFLSTKVKPKNRHKKRNIETQSNTPNIYMKINPIIAKINT